MQLGLNQATTMKNADMELDICLCDEIGFYWLELRTEDKLPAYLKRHSFVELAEEFSRRRLKPLSLNAIIFFNNRSSEETRKIFAEFREMVASARAIGARQIVAVPLISSTERFHRREIHKSCVEMLREFSDIAGEASLSISFEFIGHPDATVNDFLSAYDIVVNVDRPNVGLVLDCFHFHAMGSRVEDLEQSDPSRIFIVHLDDAEDLPRGALRDEHRLWPGEGAIDLDAILGTLKKNGWDGPITVELFRPEYYALPPEEVVRKAYESARDVVSRHFCLDEVGDVI